MRKLTRKKESSFQSEWTRSIKEVCATSHISFFYYKIPDMASKDGYTEKKPFDCHGVFNGLPVAMELKSQGKNETISFAFDNVEQHQLYYLKQFEKAGGKAYIVIYLHTKGISVVYTVDKWLALQIFATRKSITIDSLIDNALLIINKKKGTWDMLELLR